MKREMKDRRKYARKTYPLFFWRECKMCHQEFRREWGWKFWDVRDNRMPVRYFICCECAPTYEEADSSVMKMRPPRPKLPLQPEPLPAMSASAIEIKDKIK